MAMVKQEIAHRGWLRYGKQASNKARQLIKQGLHVLVKKVVVPKEAETSTEAGRSTKARRAAATDGYSKSGFFILLRWLI